MIIMFQSKTGGGSVGPPFCLCAVVWNVDMKYGILFVFGKVLCEWSVSHCVSADAGKSR